MSIPRWQASFRYNGKSRRIFGGIARRTIRTDTMSHELESIAESTAALSSTAQEEPSTMAAAKPFARKPMRDERIGAVRWLGLACSFGITLCMPFLSIGVLLAVKPILPASYQPVGALTFVLVFAYIMACLLAIGEATSRPLTPRSRSKRPSARLFAIGFALAVGAPAIVVAAAPYVSQSLLARGLVCLQAALCAGGFAACLITSIRWYRTAFGRTRDESASASASSVEPGDASPLSLPANIVLRVQNGFDRSTVRSLAGIGLVSCAAGIGMISLLAPARIGDAVLGSIGIALVVLSCPLSILVIRAERWTRVALAQWLGLLVGLNIGYFTLFGGALGPHLAALLSASCIVLFLLGAACLLSHSTERQIALPIAFPIPEQIVALDDFCSDAAKEFSLTPREEETLLLLLENLDAHEIAEELGVLPKTAKAYLRRICKKIGADCIDDLIETLDAWDAQRSESVAVPVAADPQQPEDATEPGLSARA